jgi:hypothetical protein
MVRPEVALATNREGWNRVAPRFHGSTALPTFIIKARKPMRS